MFVCEIFNTSLRYPSIIGYNATLVAFRINNFNDRAGFLEGQVQNVWAIATPLLVDEFWYLERCSDFENNHNVFLSSEIFPSETVTLPEVLAPRSMIRSVVSASQLNPFSEIKWLEKCFIRQFHLENSEDKDNPMKRLTGAWAKCPHPNRGSMLISHYLLYNPVLCRESLFLKKMMVNRFIRSSFVWKSVINNLRT